VMGPRTLIL
nr:Chain E, Peptide from Glycoprotein [synthetic construct]3AM8_F Chain F, Peptide from Glycoprotein [synthetic construct]